MDPKKLLQAVTNALNIIGEGFTSGKLFLPKLIYASDCPQDAIKVLEYKITSDGNVAEHKCTIVLGTVKGNLHDIGKSIDKKRPLSKIPRKKWIRCWLHMKLILL